MRPGRERSGSPVQRGGGCPPRDNSLRVTAPAYRPISRQVQEVPLEQLLEDVLDPVKRGPALIQLAHRRKSVPDFSLIIWRSPAMIALIIQEILRIYPYLKRQEEMPDDDCHRVSCAVSLLQPIAKDDRLRADFLRAAMPEYLYPFLMNSKESASFNKLRLTSLGIIGFLVHKSDMQAVKYLLESERVTLCIRCMEVRSCEPTITTAVYIMEKILTTEIGQEYICANQERFLMIIHPLASMFKHPHIRPSSILLQRVVNCFYLFSCNPSVSKTLVDYLPDTFLDGSFRRLFQDDNQTLERVYQMMLNTFLV